MARTMMFCAAAVCACHPALAQEDGETRFNPVVVEGSRIAQTQAEIGSSVSIITAEEIDAFGFDFAVEAIAAAPGVTVNSNGAFGGAASVRIRGASTGQTLVLIDGVPVNDPTAPAGGFDFGRLDTDSIDRLEILKGPQSTLWGGDAIGGVVSIVTKRPDEGFGAGAFAEYGSFNTYRGGASIEHGGETGDVRLAASAITSDGISKADEDDGNFEDDPYEAVTLSGRGGVDLGAGARLAASALWTDAETAFDGFSFTAPGGVADADEVSKTEELSAHVTLTAPAFSGRLENLLLVGYSDIERENLSSGAPSFSAQGDRVVYRYQGTIEIDARNTLAAGVEREESEANGEAASIDGLFALYEFKPINTLTLTGGLRVDDHDRFGTETTGRAAAAYNPVDGITLRASWGQGFKAPTIFQSTFFCCGAEAANDDLKAETSEAFDLGVDWRSPNERIEAGATYFDQEVENQIDFSFLLGGYENIAEATSTGVEIYAAYALNDWLKASVDYAFIDAQDGSGAPLARVPENTGSLSLLAEPGGPLSGALLVRYNGEETNTDGSELGDWVRVDLSASYDVAERIELFGRIENLLDENYQRVLGYGAPSISGSIGLRARY